MLISCAPTFPLVPSTTDAIFRVEVDPLFPATGTSSHVPLTGSPETLLIDPGHFIGENQLCSDVDSLSSLVSGLQSDCVSRRHTSRGFLTGEDAPSCTSGDAGAEAPASVQNEVPSIMDICVSGFTI